MNLFVVLTIAGKIAGTWGPISQPMDLCQKTIASHNAELAELNSDYHMTCEYHEKRPKLDYR